jgi:hypothetical protein
MDQKKPASKTLPYTLIAASSVVLLILISGAMSSGKFSVGPMAIILFAATGIVVWKAWFKKNSE